MSVHLIRSSLIAAGLVFLLPFATQASPTETPEKETLRLAKTLKAIPNDEWKEIAGAQITGKYEIAPGDTLSSISKRMFGDSRYWPKIWALNNTSILNPHVIRPGNQIAFMPGSGTSLPSVSIEERATATDAPAPIRVASRKMRSAEWRDLPPQVWEQAEVDPRALEQPIVVMSNLARVHAALPPNGIPAFASAQLVRPIGEIASSPSAYTYFRVNDEVLIRGEDGLVPGEIYSLISPPASIQKDKKKKPAYAYRVVGEVQITGQDNDYWIASIKSVKGLVSRRTTLVPRIAPVAQLDPVAAPESINGTLYLDRAESTHFIGQSQFGFIDRGSEDGIQPGMIFESYQHFDGRTGTSLGPSQLFRICDLQVVYVTEKYSTVEVIAGNSEIDEGTSVQLLTDVSKFIKSDTSPSSKPIDEPAAPEPEAEPSVDPSPLPSVSPAPESPKNELDELDSEDQLNEDEERELKQLEHYKATAPEEAPAPETAPTTAPPQDEPESPQEPSQEPSVQDAPDELELETPAPPESENLPPSTEPQVVD